MNPLLKSALAAALKAVRRVKEKAGLASGFSQMEMHLWMLADEARSEAYERAIERAVRPGDVVVDVGAGTGLLSFMACRAGAARVYAVEETSILDLARSLAAANGYGDRFIPVRAHSRRARLPERADVVLSETIGAFVFSEDILSSLADARERFLKPGGVLVPEGVKVSLAPVETFEEGVGLLERPVRGFDFRPAAALVPTETMIAARRVRSSHFLDSERVLYEIDFRTAGADGDFDRELEFTAGRDGVLHGFAGYWEATLHGDIRLGVLPDGPARHWTPLLFRLPAGLPVARDDRILLRFGRKDRPGWVWRWSARVERPVPR